MRHRYHKVSTIRRVAIALASDVEEKTAWEQDRMNIHKDVIDRDMDWREENEKC